MKDDDDLRFGDVGKSEGGVGGKGDDIINYLIQAFVALIILYVLLSTIEILFNIPIPLVG